MLEIYITKYILPRNQIKNLMLQLIDCERMTVTNN